jgi:hypothetical protein
LAGVLIFCCVFGLKPVRAFLLGFHYHPKIDSALTDAGVGVLLVSSDLLNSDFIHENELGPLLKRAQDKGVTILWIPIRYSGYKQTPLKNYQALSRPDRPLSGMTKAKREQAWVEICQQIYKELNTIRRDPLVRHEGNSQSHETTRLATKARP